MTRVRPIGEESQAQGRGLALTLLEVLGGYEVLGVDSILDLPDKIREGLPMEALMAVSRVTALSQDMLARHLMMAPRTLQRHRRGNTLLPQSASNQLVSLARLYQRAVNVLGSHEDAIAWMNHPNITLGDKTPVELIDTVVGEERVLALLGRIEHGVYS